MTRRIFLFLRYLPRKARRFLGQRFNDIMMPAILESVGKDTHVQIGVYINHSHNVNIGSNCLIAAGTRVTSEFKTSKISIHNNVNINCDVLLDFTGGLDIGDGVLVSEGAMVYTHDHGFNPRSPPKGLVKKIGSDAWIGARAVILPGCQYIGSASIIGAASVVTKDVPDGAIVVGNPARQVATQPPIGS